MNRTESTSTGITPQSRLETRPGALNQPFGGFERLVAARIPTGQALVVDLSSNLFVYRRVSAAELRRVHTKPRIGTQRLLFDPITSAEVADTDAVLPDALRNASLYRKLMTFHQLIRDWLTAALQCHERLND